MIDLYVTSYVNPDTDGVCSSIAYSMYAAKKGLKYKPIMFGNISDETSYILNITNIKDIDTSGQYDETIPVLIIDTHSILQIPHLKSPQKVIKIIDHHQDGDESVFPNAVVDNRRIGAAASIVAEIVLNDGLMDECIAILLGAAIISNTLNFTAPSTTDFDREMFSQLNRFYSFTNQFVAQMFNNKNKILEKDYLDVINSDIKLFSYCDKVIAISQLELINVDDNLNYQSLIKAANIVKKEKDIFLINVIDVLKKTSKVLALDDYSKVVRNHILKNNTMDDFLIIDRVLLRKTDFIPQIREYLINEV